MRRTLQRKYPLVPMLAVLAAFALFGGTCPPPPEVRYICFGDSATQGLPGGSYPQVLEEMLVDRNGEQQGCVANRGQVGDIACLSYQRLLENIDGTLHPNAHTVLYWEGGNDLFYYLYDLYGGQNFSLNHGPQPGEESHIEAIAENCILHAAEMIRSRSLAVIVGTYFQVIPGKPVTGIPQGLTTDQAVYVNQYVDALNAAILAMAQAEGVPVAPIHTLGVLGGSPDFYYDGMHPNEQGYALIAAVWYDAIQGLSP